MHYLLAICYYELLRVKKKILFINTVKKGIYFVIKNSLNTDYAYDPKFKIDLINDMSAAKEIYIGRHYIKKKMDTCS